MPPTCRSCGTSFEPWEILDACDVSWPNQRWLLFTCPCGKTAHVEVSDDGFAIGDIDGAPGPCFYPEQTIALPGLRVTVRSAGITLVWRGHRKSVPARR